MADDEILELARKLGWEIREDFKYGTMIFRPFPKSHVPVNGETIAWGHPQDLLLVPEFMEAVTRLKAQ